MNLDTKKTNNAKINITILIRISDKLYNNLAASSKVRPWLLSLKNCDCDKPSEK